MRKKLLLSVAAAAVVALGVAGGTMALFSASAGPNNNTFTAGTLRFDSFRDMGDTINGPMFYTTAAEGVSHLGAPGLRPTGYWAPGDTHTRVLMVRNIGSLDGYLTGVRANMHAGTSRYLADKLQVTVTDQVGTVLASGTLGQFIDADQTFSTRLQVNAGPMVAPKQIHFRVHLPLNADNTYQNLTLKVDFTVYAEQVKNNP